MMFVLWYTNTVIENNFFLKILIFVILYFAAMTGYVVIVGDTFSRLIEQIGKYNHSLTSCVTEAGFVITINSISSGS